MMRLPGLKIMAGPIVAAFVLAGCGEDATGACEADLQASADALSASVDAMVDVAASMKVELYAACAAIATDLGASPDAAANPSAPTDPEVTAACDAAVTAIADAKASLSGSLTVEVQGGHCEVNASAQMNCEAECAVEGTCDPGSVEARCTDGNLSVACDASCEGTLSCEATATAPSVECNGECAAQCTGTCSGTCKGTCSGTCSAENAAGECEGTCEGECQGQCSATCDGTCSGTCTYTPGTATAECSGEARCKGTCSVEGEAPRCEAELDPPECDIKGECQAGCKGQAQFEAECTPPQVVVVAEGNAELTATLEANYPTIVKVAGQAELAGRAVVGVVDATGDLIGELEGSVACAASLAAEFRANAEASVEAQASINVSVEASASVSGEAGAG